MTSFHLKLTIDEMTFFSKYVISHFFDEDVSCSPSYGVYLLQLIRFAGVDSDKFLTDGFS